MSQVSKEQLKTLTDISGKMTMLSEKMDSILQVFRELIQNKDTKDRIMIQSFRELKEELLGGVQQLNQNLTRTPELLQTNLETISNISEIQLREEAFKARKRNNTNLAKKPQYKENSSLEQL